MLMNLLEHLDAVFARQPDIEVRQVIQGASQAFECLVPVPGGGHLVPCLPQNAGEGLLEAGFVVDNQDLARDRHRLLLFSSTGSQIWNAAPPGALSTSMRPLCR